MLSDFRSAEVIIRNSVSEPGTRPGLIKRNNFRVVEIDGAISFQNDTEYDAFVGGSERQLQVTFQGQDAISATPTNYNTIRFDAPAFRYKTLPVVIQGPGRIVSNFTGNAMYHQGSGLALEMCLVNTRVSNYAVNTNG